MSYPRDLDDYRDEELIAELVRRRLLADQDLCTYCGQTYDKPECLRSERHKKPSSVFLEITDPRQSGFEAAMRDFGSLRVARDAAGNAQERKWRNAPPS